MKNNYNLKLKKLIYDDVDQIMQLQDEIFADLGKDTSILRLNTRKMFESCMMDPNVSVGLYDGEKLVGLAIMVDAAGTDEDLSLHLVKSYASCPKSVNFKSVLLRKPYYGIGFQRRMACIMEEIACRRGYNMICATVSPDNKYSKNNLLNAGYTVDHTEEKYGGLIRNVCVKKIVADEYRDYSQNTDSILAGNGFTDY